MIALGLDPGFASFGWAAVELHDAREQLLGLGVIRTAKGKGKVLVRDDEHRRAGEIAQALLAITRAYPPGVICAEALSLGGGGPAQRMQIGTMAKMGRAWGIVDALCEVHQIALLQCSPQTLKAKTAGKGATKLAVQAHLDARFRGEVVDRLAHIRAKSQHEHAVDALGAIVALLDHDHMRLARAARRGPA